MHKPRKPTASASARLGVQSAASVNSANDAGEICHYANTPGEPCWGEIKLEYAEDLGEERCEALACRGHSPVVNDGLFDGKYLPKEPTYAVPADKFPPIPLPKLKPALYRAAY